MIDPRELRAVEAGVTEALATGDASGLPLLGHGEISLVLGWPPDDPKLACKRLPPFRDLAAFERYADVVRRYVDELRARGVRVLDTELHRLVRPDGRVVGFHVQPAVAPDALGPAVLRRSDAALGHPLVPAAVEAVVRVTHERLGVDAQVSNWAWLDGEPWQLDLTTPILLDERRRPAFDLSAFLAVLPAPTRPIVRREMVSLIRRWTTARGTLLDMASNLLKEGLDDWLDPLLAEANERVDPPITRQEAARVLDSDRRLWPLLFRLEHANRWWQRHVRRRTFDFLLPERTTYEEAGPSGTRPAPS